MLILLPQALYASHGDANGDGRVDIEDARLIANFLVGNVPSIPFAQDADVNRDGRISTADALLILQFAKGLRTGFDFQAPQVLAVVPANGATNVLLTANVSVFFSEPISSTSLQGTLILTDTVTGQPVAGRIECSQDGVIETFFPDQPLEPNRLYRVNISTGVRDLEGNPLKQAFTSTFQTQAVGTLVLVSTNNPSAPINTSLAQPITVKALSSMGSPVRQALVVFTARMGAGTFQPSGLRQVTVPSDENGIAQAPFQLGGQAVEHTVEISATGFTPTLLFQARALSTQARNLRIFAGNNQNCPTGATALLPLQVKATDEGGNAVQGTTVTFKIMQGDGSFAGFASSQNVTNSSGVASAVFTHGRTPGGAMVDAFFDGMVGQPPAFTLLGLEPRPSSPTAIVGTVIDHDSRLLPGIKVFLLSNPQIKTNTNAGGAFRLEPVPPGLQTFIIDAANSPPIDGVTFTDLAFELNVIQGQDNTIQMPAILGPIDPLSSVDVSEVQGGTLTLRANPLWKLFLKPGQAVFPDGSRRGRIHVALIPSDKIPMLPPEGKVARFFVAIEPPLVKFSPPADVQFPNSDNLPPGTVTEIFSFDHNLGLFVPVGRGQVSEDGSVIRSLPGEGMIHGGWHQTPDPEPPPTTSAGGNADGCNSHVTTCGMSAPIDPLTGNFILSNIPINCGQRSIRPLFTCDVLREAIPPDLARTGDKDGGKKPKTVRVKSTGTCLRIGQIQVDSIIVNEIAVPIFECYYTCVMQDEDGEIEPAYPHRERRIQLCPIQIRITATKIKKKPC